MLILLWMNADLTMIFFLGLSIRICLNMGGDDITECLLVLLERIHFPYRDVDLSRSYDWSLMEDLKAKLCTMAEVSRNLCFSSYPVPRPSPLYSHPTIGY